jgi:hypothetical protein
MDTLMRMQSSYDIAQTRKRETRTGFGGGVRKSRSRPSAGRSYGVEAVPERTGRERMTWTR